jgi:hypothetical protein
MKAQMLVMLHTDPLLTFGGTGVQAIMHLSKVNASVTSF